MEPIVLFSIQFTMSLLVYHAHRHLVCDAALVQVAERAGPDTPGLGTCVSLRRRNDLRSWRRRSRRARGFPDHDRVWRHHHSGLAIIALLALHARIRGAIALVWLVLIVGAADTVNAIVQSTRDRVFNYPLGVNWLIVTLYVPALIVSSVLILIYLFRPEEGSPEGLNAAEP